MLKHTERQDNFVPYPAFLQQVTKEKHLFVRSSFRDGFLPAFLPCHRSRKGGIISVSCLSISDGIDVLLSWKEKG